MFETVDNLEGFKDDLISDVVKKGVRALPNAYFEDRMMRKIQAEVDCKNEVVARLKISLMFFVGAIFSGLVSVLVILFGEVFEQYDVKTITILSLFVIGVFGILNIDNYRRIISTFS